MGTSKTIDFVKRKCDDMNISSHYTKLAVKIAENIDKLTTLSDSVWRDFGQKYGFIIKDMGLLTRAVLILDKRHNIIYKQLVSNLSTEPEYDSVIEKLKML
jgi:thiol peroxidase